MASTLYAQNNTEVFVFDLNKEGQNYSLSNPVNISDNPGYDNQPYFLADGSAVLFSSTRNGQTDVLRYNLSDGSKTWLTDSEGSEYSPTVMPNGKYFSTIILEEDGTQQLWKYPFSGDKAEVLISDIVIGYHAWYNENTLYSFVLGEPPTLQRSDLNTGNHMVITENPGRSLHKIPDSGNISYVDKSDSTKWIIKSIDPDDGTITPLAETLSESEDMAWSPSGYIFMGKGSKLYVNNIKMDNRWTEIADLGDWELSNITRLAVSPIKDKIAIVVQQ
ncbi:MAG: hypothetical protein U5J95_00280 [Balneolaceae bacterium]|nr:hypothetical protein [Balneolaceae bacterium]